MKRFLSIVTVLTFLLASVQTGLAATKEWTYMIFMNADNNLDPFADEDFGEMMKVGSSDWLNIVTVTDREQGPAALHYIEKGKNTKIRELGEIDMGDYKTLVQYAKELFAAYPARHYAISLWNHGSGWKHGAKPIVKGISYDDQSGNHITTPELGLAARQIKAALGRNLDLLTMDACLMQMMEVAWEVQPCVDFVVASEELEPGNGYPYDAHMAGLKATTTPRDFARHMVASFQKAYNGGVYGKEDTTQSALDCARLPALKDALDGLAKASMAGSFAPQFKKALDQVQKFDYRTNIDLGHLVALLKAAIPAPEFQTAVTKVDQAYKATIVANATTGDAMKNATGLAIYFPATSGSFSAEYLKLAFAKASQWDEMVKDFHKKSTSATVISDLETGNTESLREFVCQADEDQRDVASHLTTAVNFRLFSEGGLPGSVGETAAGLLRELREK
jgi:predicted dinucleotide-binding enzyme